MARPKSTSATPHESIVALAHRRVSSHRVHIRPSSERTRTDTPNLVARRECLRLALLRCGAEHRLPTRYRRVIVCALHIRLASAPAARCRDRQPAAVGGIGLHTVCLDGAVVSKRTLCKWLHQFCGMRYGVPGWRIASRGTSTLRDTRIHTRRDTHVRARTTAGTRPYGPSLVFAQAQGGNRTIRTQRGVIA